MAYEHPPNMQLTLSLMLIIQVAWSIGLLSSGIGFIGWDSASHMAEEMKNPARDLPRASK